MEGDFTQAGGVVTEYSLRRPLEGNVLVHGAPIALKHTDPVSGRLLHTDAHLVANGNLPFGVVVPSHVIKHHQLLGGVDCLDFQVTSAHYGGHGLVIK